MTKAEVKAAILAGKPMLAIGYFRQLDLSKEDEQTLSLIEAEFSSAQRKELNGILSSEQQQLASNQINDKLLKLLEAPSNKQQRSTKVRRFSILAFFSLLLLLLVMVIPRLVVQKDCPAYSTTVKNRILLIPFISLNEASAEPHLLFRDRIEALIIKKNLSTEIGLKGETSAVSIGQAQEIATDCGANVVVWGKYLQASDSISLILQYQFLDQPDWSSFGQLTKLKDITAIQSGAISKSLEDAILALCGIIAIHEGQAEVAKQWLEKVNKKDAIDLEILAELRK